MTKGAIVCVDDEPMVLLSLRDQLSRILGSDYAIEVAQSAEEALSLFADLVEDQVEVVLAICDQMMPEMDGVELLIRLHQQYPHTLKILLTGQASLDAVIQAVNQANLYRYIAKPWSETDLVLTVREALRSYEQAAQLTEQNRQLQQMNHELQREIADRRSAEMQLAHDALHDALTRLPNRTLFIRRVEQAIQAVQQFPAQQFAVMFIDLDRFKLVNDSLGHLVGDELLIAIAQRLKRCLRTGDSIARLGGDEFTILLGQIAAPIDAVHVAQRLLDTLRAPFKIKDHTLFSSASIGIAIGSGSSLSAADLLRDADLAMYYAKGAGKARYALFNQELHIQSLKLLKLESDLRQALTRQEFVLHYQPIVMLATGEWIGFEALVRWQHPSQGMVPPNEFISVAEETGLIIPLGEWVLREACRQLQIWRTTYPQQAALTVSVNLTGKQVREPDFVRRIAQILTETGLDGHYLKLELTESMLLDEVEIVLRMLTKLREKNIQLSIDDFGTGYSSLSYLPRFPIDALKIDRTFIDRMTADAENFEIVRAIVMLAHSIGLDVVAEGIETPEQVAQLRSLDCKFGQGYWFSKPLDAAAIERAIAAKTPRLSER